MSLLKNIGPATIIAAAFIGPGTVSVCALAGFHHGLTLLWVMLLAMVMTIFLQELAARLAILHQKDLTELVQNELSNRIWLKGCILILVFVAIVFGNTAYEAGNLSGVNIGLQTIDFKDFMVEIFGANINYAVVIISIIAFFILHLKQYKYIERTLMVLVGVLSVSFIISAIMTSLENPYFWAALLSPGFPKDDILALTALIGTTVVPYNLFLHAALAKQKWKTTEGISAMRVDTFAAVGVGVLVSICIIITTSNISAYTQDILGIGIALEPLFGKTSSYFVGIGFIAAGLTSAVTAPLAAAYVLNKLFKLNYSEKSIKFKRLSYAILFIGCIVAALDFNPIEVIRIAQVANAIILPILVILIIWLAYKLKTSAYKFGKLSLSLGIIVLLLSLTISISSLYKVLI
jgi:Mn2+/Fe2+ NRAMP family transporter